MTADYKSMQLGDIVWEAAPWDGVVKERKILHVRTDEWLGDMDSPLGRVASGRTVWAEGGTFGLGEQITGENWLKRFFPNTEDAEKACAEQAVKLKEEQRRQVEAEMKGLQAEFDAMEEELS